MALIGFLWKFWTGAVLIGAAMGWWSWSWGLALFFAPDLLLLGFMLVAVYEGRRIRKAEERAAARSVAGD